MTMNFKYLTTILNVISVVESVMARKSGKDKLEASIDAAGPLIADIESAVGKDVLHEENVRPVYDRFVAAAIDLMKAIAAAKALPVKPVPNV